MKLSSKPISSPGRTEKFPPPLMRFLKSNGGSRSRRSRSSPMFVRKKNAGIETQEPSSPKVTCMGQVRVRRSKQTAKKKGRTGTTSTRKRCKWIPKSLFCKCLSSKKSNPKSSRTVWRSWFLCYQNGYRKKVEIIEESAKIESKSEIEEEKEEVEEVEAEEEEEVRENKGFVSSSTPPKNALLLMRCRSDPCRNSSLLNRFWGSPSTTEDSETEQINRAHVGNEGEEEEEENEEHMLEKEPICIESSSISRLDPETDEKIGFCESSSSERSATTKTTINKIKDEVNGDQEGAPLILTRCKSEPATRSSMKVDTETCFWNKRKSGFNEHILL